MTAEKYNPFTPEAIGKIGEDIVKDYFESIGFQVPKMPDRYPSFDHLAYAKDGIERYIQVKTTMCYANPFFGLPTRSANRLINTYREFEDSILGEFQGQCKIYFVCLQTPKNGAKMWSADFQDIEGLINPIAKDSHGYTYGIDIAKWAFAGVLKPIILNSHQKQMAECFLNRKHQNLDLDI
jgi:hypothetical protein